MIHRYDVPDHPVIREMELFGAVGMRRELCPRPGRGWILRSKRRERNGGRTDTGISLKDAAF